MRWLPEPITHGRRCLPLAVALLLLNGCAAFERADFQQTVADLDFAVSEVSGDSFTHRVLHNRPAQTSAATRLHLYIDGDGLPWLGRGRPAADPTPRNPLVLRLMALDPTPAIYLGRPCYAGAWDEPDCNAWQWTHGRYSETVVTSMTRAAQHIVAEVDAEQVVLIGFSGGGTLAMLIAARLEGVSTVVTLAGNLDVASWTALHDYSPLTGSLDPATQVPLPSAIAQWHWVGENDQRVPPHLIRGAVQPGPQVHLDVLPGVDHNCCWEAIWPELLTRLR